MVRGPAATSMVCKVPFGMTISSPARKPIRAPPMMTDSTLVI